MKHVILFILLAFIGCADSDENAASNFKKGNDFFEKKEYEVAEYYYERIPESSPLYKEAEKKLDVIAAIKKQWVEKKISEADLSKVVLQRHTFKVDNTEKFPIHSLSVENNTDIKLEYLDVEFTYLDKANNIVATLEFEIHAKLPKHSQDIYSNLRPGIVDGEFVSATAKIVNAHFK